MVQTFFLLYIGAIFLFGKKIVTLPQIWNIEMIVEIIAKYLESNKRLVVPNLGTFIVKVPQQTVLFSNLMKSDDGVLRSEIVKSGVSELDAAALIDRFVFEVNDRLAKGGVCALSGFGVLRSGANGTVGFTFDVKAKGDVLDNDASEKLEAHLAAKAAQAPQPKVAPQPSVKEEETIIEIVPAQEPSQPIAEPSQPTQEPKAELKRPAERRPRPQQDYVKGLRYGKGRKVVTGREGATSRKSRKSDLIMKIAIGAAIIATLALAYGFYNDWRNQQFLNEGLYDDEQIYNDAPASAEEGVRNPDLDYITPNN